MGWVLALLTLGAGPAELKTVEWQGHSFFVAIADLSKVELRVHLGPPPSTAVVATNAGIFEPDHLPTGLLVSDGVERHPLNSKSGEGNFYLAPNGVFLVSRSGARVVASSDYPPLKKGVLQATQSGPLLVQAGVVHPGFSKTSKNALLRSGIGVTKDGQVVIAISNGPVTFYDFATLFRDSLGCSDALYLDGVISKLWVPSSGVDDPSVGNFAGVLSLTPLKSR